MSTKTSSAPAKPKAKKSAAKFFRASQLSSGIFDALMVIFQKAVYSAANGIVGTISPGTTWLPVSTDSLGPLNFYWQNGSFFNAYTWNYINNLFAYNATNNNYYTNGDGLNTALYNAFSGISYQLSPADETVVNKAYLDNNGNMATLVTNFINGGYGSVPPGNTQAQYNFVVQAMLNWSVPAGSTLPPVSYTAFFQSPSPAKLLTYAPPGSANLITQLIRIVNAMSSANAIIGQQQAVLSEISSVLNNIQGPVLYNAGAVPPAGWMALSDNSGALPNCQPQWILNPQPAQITTGLETGSSFTVTMKVTDINASSCTVSVNGSAGVSVGIGFFGLTSEVSGSYDLASMTTDITAIEISMSFNGVTSISMMPAAYNLSSNTGWWLPSVLSQAVNSDTNVSGPYMPPSVYNFSANGNFGVLNNLFISQLPKMTVNFATVNADELNQMFTASTSWGFDFLGIDFASVTTSNTYTSNVSNFSGNSITIEMNPPAFPSSLPTNNQTAFVIGASLTWPGAPTS